MALLNFTSGIRLTKSINSSRGEWAQQQHVLPSTYKGGDAEFVATKQQASCLDWYHFCGRMFHPPLLASNWFLSCLCLNRDIYSTCCYCDILLRYVKHFAWFQCNCTKQDWISYSCWQIRILCLSFHERLVQAFIHMIVQCALRCCATCIGTVLNKCWIEAIVLLSFPIK